MRAGALLGVVRRQRRLLLAALLLAVVAGVAVLFLSPARYASSAVLAVRSPVLVGPVVQRPYEGMHRTNPLVRDDSGLNSVAKILIEGAATDATGGSGATVTVSDGREDPSRTPVSPVVVVAAEGPDADATRIAATEEVARLTSSLLRLQVGTGVPGSTDMSLETVVAPAAGAQEHKAAARTGLAAVAVVAVLGVLVAFARDGARP